MHRMNSSGIHLHTEGILARPLRGAHGEAARVPGDVKPETHLRASRLRISRNHGQDAGHGMLYPIHPLHHRPNLSGIRAEVC